RNAVMTHDALPEPEPEPPELGEGAGDDGSLPAPLPVLATLVAAGRVALPDVVPVTDGDEGGMLAVAGGRIPGAPAAGVVIRAVGWATLASGVAVPHAASDAIARTPAAIGSQRRGEPTAAQVRLPNPLPASHQLGVVD